MKKFAFAIALTMLLTSGIQSASFAEQNQPMPGDRQGHFGPPPHEMKFDLKEKLNLSEEQAAKAKQIRESSRAKMEPIISQLRTEMGKMRELHKNNASKDEIQKQREKIKALRTQLKPIHEKNMADFEAILTPEQKAKFEQLKQEKRKEFKQKMMERRAQFGNKRFGENKQLEQTK